MGFVVTYDAIIIGGGHNGLVTACYLARANWKVLVLERRYIVGGACVSEEIFPGFKVSTAAYVNSLFRPEIIRDLRLKDYGFEILERNPSSFSPFHDGRYLHAGARPRPARSARSQSLASKTRRIIRNTRRCSSASRPSSSRRSCKLPRILPNRGSAICSGWRRSVARCRNSDRQMSEAIEVLTGPARPILDRWFESEELKGTLATDAIIGAFASPSMPGTAYVLFHHVMGETNGKRGVWAYVKGGMGGLTQALAEAAQDLGVEIRTNAEVRKINVRNGHVAGVTLANGDEFAAARVASGVDCNVTFNQLLDEQAVPPEFLAAIKRIDYSSASMKINVALSALPNFTACPGSEPGPQHHGTVHLVPDQDFIERALR